MPGDDHPKTRSRSQQAVDEAAGTLPSTTDPNLVTGEASNKTNSPTTTPTDATATAAAAATTDGDNSTSLGSSRTNETVRRTLFSPANTADEAAIDNQETEKGESDDEPTDHYNSTTNTATMSASPFDTDLRDILTRVLNLDITTTPPPDIVEGLAHHGTFSWIDFVTIDPLDIAHFSKQAGPSRVPLFGFQTRVLTNLILFIGDNKSNRVPDALTASTYTEDNFDDFLNSLAGVRN